MKNKEYESFTSYNAIRSRYKRAFIDPSIAVASLGLTPEALHTQLKTFGFIFEQMCARVFKDYTLDSDTHLSYYHVRYGLGTDLVFRLSDGCYALIECWLAAKNFLNISPLFKECTI